MNDRFSRDAPLGAGELRLALRSLHSRAMSTSLAADRVEALLLTVVKALIDAGELDRDQLDRALEAHSSSGSSMREAPSGGGRRIP